MKHIMLLLLVLATTGITGCETEQDPFRGDKRADQAIPPTDEEPQKKGEPPFDKEALQIGGPTVSVFREMEERHFNLDVRVMHPDKPDWEVEAIDLPNGAFFDPVDLKFIWMPPINYVDGESVFKAHTVTFRLTAQTSPVSVAFKTVELIVYRQNETPTIINVNDIPKELKEGERHDFTVDVEDNETITVAPKLMFVPSKVESRDATGLITFVSTVPEHIDTHVWRYKMRIDLRNRLIQDDIQKVETSLVATSKWGILSPAQKINFTILAEVGQPKVTWEVGNNIEINQGERSYFTFDMYDPVGRGKIKYEWVQPTNCALLPGIGGCSCKKVTESRSTCRVLWQPPTLDEDYHFTFKIKVFNIGPHNQEEKLVIRSVKVNKVEAGNPSGGDQQ